MFELGDEFVKVILPAHKEYSAIRYYEKGITSRDRGDTDQAREYFIAATDIDKSFVHAYFDSPHGRASLLGYSGEALQHNYPPCSCRGSLHCTVLTGCG